MIAVHLLLLLVVAGVHLLLLLPAAVVPAAHVAAVAVPVLDPGRVAEVVEVLILHHLWLLLLHQVLWLGRWCQRRRHLTVIVELEALLLLVGGECGGFHRTG